MQIISHAHLKLQRSDGEQLFAAADRSLGVRHFEIWMRALEPGAHSQEKRHAGELVVVVLAGCGKLLVDGGPQRFCAPCTVLVPPHRTFQFVNHGALPLQMVAVCTETPVPAHASTPDEGTHD
jgi:mannose-6-phosphate isomerase-like protein (cupin superfamily)